jgi:DNA polymerase-3 subunit alpha
MPLSEVDEIAKNIEESEQYYRDRYPELFHYVDLIQGTVVSIGAHACGIAVSPIPLDEHMGLITTIDNETKQPVVLTQINMKEIDAQNFVKLDVLGLDTVEIISNTVDLAGLNWEDILPENLDSEDEKVWESILENNIAIFQWESDFAHQVYKDLFSKETIAKIKQVHPNFSYMDLFSLGNAILRPAGASYRESVMQGEFYDNGHEALNRFLAPTLGRLAYQEQIS